MTHKALEKSLHVHEVKMQIKFLVFRLLSEAAGIETGSGDTVNSSPRHGCRKTFGRLKASRNGTLGVWRRQERFLYFSVCMAKGTWALH